MCDSPRAHATSRRAFLGAAPALVGWALQPLRTSFLWRAPWVPGEHPEPREGIDASLVVTAEALRAEGHGDDVVEAFDMVRQIPQVADGLACYCGCMLMGNRSLLTCYYDRGMARGCRICQGEGRLAYRRWKEGQTLDQIRRAIDARYNV